LQLVRSKGSVLLSDIVITLKEGSLMEMLPFLANATLQIATLFKGTQVAVALGSVGLAAWQEHQAKKLEIRIADKIRTLGMEKLDRGYIHTDEFHALLLQGVRIAAETASDTKREAIASALVNSAWRPSKFSGKTMLMRLLDQLSEEELQVAVTIRTSMAFALDDDHATCRSLARELKWDNADTYVTILGLESLGLVQMRTLDANAQDYDIEWSLSPLTERLIEWCLPPEDAEKDTSTDQQTQLSALQQKIKELQNKGG
jgi:hypothetical protein